MSNQIVKKDAVFSADRVHRYVLYRIWDEAKFPLVVIGLNPSTADEDVDDPTIRRCISFAKREGCGGLIMLNLFSYRATDPGELKSAINPDGGVDHKIALDMTKRVWGGGSKFVAAWGVHGSLFGRDKVVKAIFPDLYCFGKTLAGHPKHPLYLSGLTSIVPFT